jgi:hypothetical protein
MTVRKIERIKISGAIRVFSGFFSDERRNAVILDCSDKSDGG